MIGSFTFILNVYQIRIDPVATFYLPQTRFWELIIGSLLAYINLFNKPFFKANLYHNLKSVIGVVMIGSGLYLTNEQDFPGWWAILPTLGTVLIISSGSKTWINRVLLSNKILVWFGLISFPLYLWHWPLLSFAYIIYGGLPSTTVRLLLVIIAIIAAWLTYQFIERPIRFNSNKKHTTLNLSLMILVLGISGYAAYITEGFKNLRNFDNFTMNSKISEQLVGPEWKYVTNNICLSQFPYEESIGFCIKNLNDELEILLLGNSHANQLYPGFVQNTKLKNHSILSIGACDPVIDDNQDKNGTCFGDRQLKQQKFINDIDSNTKSIKFIIIDGLNRHPSAEYISLLQKRIDFFEGNGGKIIIFTPHIRPEFNPKNCFTRPLRTVTKDCTFSPKLRDEYLNNFRPLIEYITKTNPNTLFYDQNEIYCESEVCSFIKKGLPLFRDHVHLSEFGSNELANHFTICASSHAPEILNPTN